MMASEALYISVQGNKVVAGRTDIIGSIGTKLVLLDLSKMFEQDGVRVISVDTGFMKSAGEPGLPITDEQVAEFQRIVDFYFADFVKEVQRGRGMSRANVLRIADGRFWPAVEARGIGLVDRIETVDQTISRLRR